MSSAPAPPAHTRSTASGAAQPTVSALPRGFQLVAAGYVPFETRTDEHHAVRAELRRHLRRLEAEPGEVLHAQLTGGLPSGADIENALLYNVDMSGAALASATRHGVRFEHDPRPLPDGLVRYTYELVPADQGLRTWCRARQLAALGPVDLGTAPPRCTSVWWALTHTVAEVSGELRGADEPFGVVLDVEGPAEWRRPEAVKALVDGVVCALQAHTDATTIDHPARRIAVTLGQPVDAVAAALQDRRRAALGSRARLVHAWGKGVQWTPDDHLCVAGDIRYRHSRRWRLHAEVDALALQP